MEKNNNFLSKKDILDSAEETFRRFGPKKTSVTDIAKVLNVSHGTIYRHYPTKKALREAVTERWLEEKVISPLEELIYTEQNPANLLKAYILKLSFLKQHFAEQDTEMFAMYAEVTADSAELIGEHINKIIGHLSFIIQKGIDAQIVKKTNRIDELAKAIFYSTASFHHPAHAFEWKKQSISTAFEHVWNLISNGILINEGRRNE